VSELEASMRRVPELAYIRVADDITARINARGRNLSNLNEAPSGGSYWVAASFSGDGLMRDVPGRSGGAGGLLTKRSGWPRKAYIEVMSFDRLVNSATERNRAFFDKLGLPSA
jgi:hypothetical protein